MKCGTCSSENPADSRFCIHCGARLGSAACGACGSALPPGAELCPGCGFPPAGAESLLAAESFEHQLYRAARSAFYRRFVERAERKSAETSLYRVIRLLARRPIELDIAASLGDLAGVLSEAARPYVASLRRREVQADLTAFLGIISGELQQRLEGLDALSRAAGAELTDHPIGPNFSRGSGAALPAADHLWPGIAAWIGPAIDLGRIASRPSSEAELLERLNEAFAEVVAAYDRLWQPLFAFVVRYMTDKCHLLLRRLSSFEADFDRYSARLAECRRAAAEEQLEAALAAALLAREAGPDEPLAPLLEGHLLYRLGRLEEARAAFEAGAELDLPYVSLEAERHFWTGRCLFDEGFYEESSAAFEELVALPRQQIEARYFQEAQFLLARAALLGGDGEGGSHLLLAAVGDGFTDVAAILDDPRLTGLRGRQPLQAALRSGAFLQALSRQAGILPRGSTYFSRTAAPLKAAGSWLELREDEEVVFFYDASRTGSGRHGLCLTSLRLIFRGSSGGRTESLPLERLDPFRLAESELAVGGGLVIPDAVFDRLGALAELLSRIGEIFTAQLATPTSPRPYL